MTDLKPCPFCQDGGDLVFSQPCQDGGWGVLCRTCHTYMDVRAETKAAAADRWNTRAAALPVMLEERRGEIAREISGAPFPSKRSLAKADRIISILGGGE